MEDGGRLVVRSNGRMEAADGAAFASAVEQALRPEITAVAIDLDGLDFVSLGAIRSFLRLARSLKSGGRTLDFERGGDSVRHALEQAGLHALFLFTPPIHSHRGHHDETP